MLSEADRSMLRLAAVHLDDYAALLSEHGDTGMIQLAMALRDLAEKGPHHAA